MQAQAGKINVKIVEFKTDVKKSRKRWQHRKKNLGSNQRLTAP